MRPSGKPLLILLLTAAVWTLLPAASSPLYAQESDSEVLEEPTRISSNADFCRAGYLWRRSHTVELYEQTNDDPPGLSGRVSAWLDDCARADSDLAGAPSWREISATGEQLYEAGCRHPLFVSYLAHLDLTNGRIQRSRKRHEAVAEPLLAGDYGPKNRYYEAFRLMRLDYLWGTDGPRSESERRTARAWLEMAAATKALSRQRLLWSELEHLTVNRRSGVWDRKWLSRFVVEASQDPRLHPWMQTMLAAKAFQMQAWNLRGFGYSERVKKESWRRFREASSEAELFYVEAYQMAPEFPEAATEMIAIVRDKKGVNREELLEWFDNARDAQLDYLPAYYQVLEASRSRWGGGVNTLWALAKRWSEEDRYQTNAPYMAVRSVFDIGGELQDLGKALESEEAYDLVVETLQRMAEDPAHDASLSRSYSRATLLSHCLAVAITGQKDGEARRFYDKIHHEGLAVDESVFPGYGFMAERQVGRMLARTGPASAEVVALAEAPWDELHRGREAASSGAVRYAVAKQKTDDPRTEAYFDHWIEVCKAEESFYRGGWTALDFKEGLPGWLLPTGGFWEPVGDRVVAMRRSDTTGDPYLWNAGYYLGGFELEVEIEPHFETGGSATSGVFVQAHPEGYYFWLNRTRSIASVSSHSDCTAASRVSSAKTIPSKDRYKLLARVTTDHLTMQIDGEEIVSKSFEEGGFLPNGAFCLCPLPKAEHGAEVRYRNPRIRRLTE